jgi:hypothetical protein
MTIAQTLGPEALMQYINPDEAIKRLAAAQGIDVLNLVKSMDQLQAEQEDAMAQEQEMGMMQAAPGLLKAPIVDPTKNPDAGQIINDVVGADLVPPPQE